jgi:hypothetical protein
LERSLRMHPRQVRSPKAGARGPIGAHSSWWLHLQSARSWGWGLGGFVSPPSAEKWKFPSSWGIKCNSKTLLALNYL